MLTADVDCDDSIVAVACYFYILDEQNKVSRFEVDDDVIGFIRWGQICKFWDPSKFGIPTDLGMSNDKDDKLPKRRCGGVQEPNL